MASKVKPIDIKAEVFSSLNLALKATGIDLGEGYDIEKSQKELFFENIIIKEIEHEFVSFRPINVKEQVNETDTEFHVGKAPAVRTGSTGQEVHVKGNSEAGMPTVLKVLNASANIGGFWHRKSKDGYVECSQAIPAGAKLRRVKGYDTFACKVEISLCVPSYKISFFVKKGWSTKEVKTIPARDVLAMLKGWDKSKDVVIFETTYEVEAEHSKIICQP